MDDAVIRRYLSAPRAVVLDIIARNPEITHDEIAAYWATHAGPSVPRQGKSLPRMTGEILWRLVNLEWVENRRGHFRLTDLGVRVQTVAQSDRC